MDKIKLVPPTPEMEAAAMEYKNEHTAYGEQELHGGALIDHMPYTEWLQMVENNTREETVNPAWVVSSTFFGVRESDGRIVGMIDIRHSLGNELLREYGGHIGYGVRPTERCKGYATQMLNLSLQYAKDVIGIDKVMLACYKDNEPSRKTIINAGGELEREFVYTDGKTVQVFWITL